MRRRRLVSESGLRWRRSCRTWQRERAESRRAGRAAKAQMKQEGI